ncbi:MAG: hypothetical protein OJJ54_00665 [Pseudonocardia sp.]|nr:hypothetical protein [Pseudonocardia sp.]
MTRHLSDVAATTLFRGSDAVADGCLTPAQLRGDRVLRLFRNVYTWSGTPVTHELRCRAAALALPAGAVISGRSAAAVRGVRQLCWPEDPVTVVAPLDMRLGRTSGLLVRRTMLDPSEYRDWEGGRLATPLRTGLDLLLGRALPDAVADLDAALRAEILDRTELSTALRRRSDNGVVLARQAEALADPRAESPPESRVRVHLVLAGLDPVPQYQITLDGEDVARVDLAFPARRVAVEYDGGWRDGELWALNRDRARLNRVRAAGWTVLFVTAPLLRTPRKMINEVKAALAL